MATNFKRIYNLLIISSWFENWSLSPTIIRILIIGIERLSVPFLLVISDIVANIAVKNIKNIESINLYFKINIFQITNIKIELIKNAIVPFIVL